MKRVQSPRTFEQLLNDRHLEFGVMDFVWTRCLASICFFVPPAPREVGEMSSLCGAGTSPVEM